MWVIFALLGALSKSVGTVARKPMTQYVDPIVGVILMQIPMVLILLTIVATTGSISEIYSIVINNFLIVTGIAATGVTAQYYWLKAIDIGDISAVVPLLSFIPVINFLLSAIVIGEIPSAYGLIGALVIVLGAYFVYLDVTHIKWYDPFIAICQSKAARFTLIPVLMWGIAPIIDKIGLNTVPINYWAASVAVTMLIMISLIFVMNSFMHKKLPRFDIKAIKFGVLGGFGITGGYLFGLTALSSTFVGYAQSVRRFDIIFTLILSAIFLGDHLALKRLRGALIMVVGTIIISLTT